MREEPSREESEQEERSVHITIQAGKLIPSFPLSTGQDVANKIPTQLSKFSSLEL